MFAILLIIVAGLNFTAFGEATTAFGTALHGTLTLVNLACLCALPFIRWPKTAGEPASPRGYALTPTAVDIELLETTELLVLAKDLTGRTLRTRREAIKAIRNFQAALASFRAKSAFVDGRSAA